MIKEKNGEKYSLKPFDEYKYRMVFVVEDLKGNRVTNTNVYTTNKDKEEVFSLLSKSAMKVHDNVKEIKCANWATKEQDDRAEKVINEWLNEEKV